MTIVHAFPRPDVVADAVGVLLVLESTPTWAMTLCQREMIRARGIPFPLRSPERAVAANG